MGNTVCYNSEQVTYDRIKNNSDDMLLYYVSNNRLDDHIINDIIINIVKYNTCEKTMNYIVDRKLYSISNEVLINNIFEYDNIELLRKLIDREIININELFESMITQCIVIDTSYLKKNNIMLYLLQYLIEHNINLTCSEVNTSTNLIYSLIVNYDNSEKLTQNEAYNILTTHEFFDKYMTNNLLHLLLCSNQFLIIINLDPQVFIDLYCKLHNKFNNMHKYIYDDYNLLLLTVMNLKTYTNNNTYKILHYLFNKPFYLIVYFKRIIYTFVTNNCCLFLVFMYNLIPINTFQFM